MPKARKPVPPEKTVFISYRREPSKYAAALMFHHLRQHGFDVFYDVQSIDSGAFDETILNQIAARMHFVVILAPGTLDRCTREDGSANTEDWLRREAEYAMDTGRNIVPVLMDNFSYKDADKFMTGKLANLSRYQSHDIPYTYLEEGLERLRKRYLKPPVNPVSIKPLSESELKDVEERVQQVPLPTAEELTAEEFFNRARQKQRSGDLNGTIADYTEAIRVNPNLPEAYNRRGDAWYSKRDYDRAIADYDKALQLDPQYIAVYYNLAYARQAKGDTDGALHDYEKLLDLDPFDATAYYKRAELFAQRKEYKKAIEELSKVIEFHPQDGSVYLMRATLFHEIGELDQALIDYQQAIQLNTDLISAYLNIGHIHRDKGDLNKAVEAYSNVLELDPEDARGYFHRSSAYYNQGDYRRSIADETEYIHRKPMEPAGYNNRGEAYFAHQNYAEALADFQKANELETNFNIALAGLAITHHALGNSDEALKLWRQLLDQDPQYRDPEWVRKELNWVEPLVEEAKKLIARL